MNKEYRAKKGLERLLWNVVFWSADIYVGMGFVTRCKRLYPRRLRMGKENRAKKGLERLLWNVVFWSAMERLLWNAVFWSADIYVGMGFVTRCKRLYPRGTRRNTRCTFFGVLWSAFFGTPFFGAPTFMSAWVFVTRCKRFYPRGTRRKTRCTFFGVLWSAFFGTSLFGAPTFMSAWVLLLDVKDSIHWGREGRLDAPFLECYGAPDFSPIP